VVPVREVEAFDFAEPAFVGGPASAGLEVVFDLCR
jgi:hypothetical protein